MLKSRRTNRVPVASFAAPARIMSFHGYRRFFLPPPPDPYTLSPPLGDLFKPKASYNIPLPVFPLLRVVGVSLAFQRVRS